MNKQEVIESLKYEDITEAMIETVEETVSMARFAFDMVDHRELLLACVKAVCIHLKDKK